MEWGKVKTILIISFLFLNLLLGYQLFESRLEIFSLVSDEAAEEVKALLREKGIEVKQEIPKETPNVREISIRYRTRPSSGERKSLTEPIPVDLEESRWRDPLKKYIPELDEYAVDRVLSGSTQFVLNQTFNGLPMFQVQIVLYLENGEITGYTRSYAEVEPFLDQKEQPALSAYRVVQFLAENRLKDGAVIEEIALGYHGQLFNSDTQVLAPKWRITMENGDVYYVHAISGELE